MQSFSIPEPGASGSDALMPSRRHFHQTYHELQQLAEGGNSTTYLAVSKQEVELIRAQTGTKKRLEATIRQKVVVIKVPRASCTSLTEATNSLSDETKILTKRLTVRHPRIVEALDSHEDKDQDIVWLAMPYIPGRALGDVKAKFPWALSERLLWHVACQVLEALIFMALGPQDSLDGSLNSHWQPVSHRDIQPYNLMFKPSGGFDLPDIVMIDFGLGTPGTDDQGGFAPVLLDLGMLGDVLEELVTDSASPDLATQDDGPQLRAFIAELQEAEGDSADLNLEQLAKLFDMFLASAAKGRNDADKTLPDSTSAGQMLIDLRSRLNVGKVLSNLGLAHDD